jgi:drug/metabolite transporter (DMT)-like permease
MDLSRGHSRGAFLIIQGQIRPLKTGGAVVLVEGLALVTAVSNAVSALLISKWMRGSDALSAALISTSVQAAILSAFLLFRIPWLNWAALALFAVSGLFALGAGRLLYFVAVGRMGVAVSSAIIGSNPLISTFLAIVFLGEGFAFTVFAGAALVVLGIFLLSGAGRGSLRGGDLAIPFLSALCYSLSNVIRKVALNHQPDPALGVQVGAVAGALSLLVYIFATGRTGEIGADGRGLLFYSAAGASSAVG